MELKFTSSVNHNPIRVTVRNDVKPNFIEIETTTNDGHGNDYINSVNLNLEDIILISKLAEYYSTTRS